MKIIKKLQKMQKKIIINCVIDLCNNSASCHTALDCFEYEQYYERMKKIAMPAIIVKLKEKADHLNCCVRALYLAFKRKETSLAAKILIAFTVGYALSPIDLIPDFIPVLGYVDDLLLLPFLIFIAIKLIPAEIFAECKEEAKHQQDTKLKKWYYGIPIIVLWLAVILIIAKKFIRVV